MRPHFAVSEDALEMPEIGCGQGSLPFPWPLTYTRGYNFI